MTAIRQLAAVLALAAAPAATGQTVPEAQWANYACTGGAVVQVAYFDPPGGPSLAAVAWAGKLVPMRVGPSASGVRYIAFDEQESYRWHVNGEEAMLVFLQADDHARDEIIQQGCRRIQP